MYEKNKTQRLTIRLTDKQMGGLTQLSQLYDVSPSEFVRQCISLTINAYEGALSYSGDEAPTEAVETVLQEAEAKTRKESGLSDKATLKKTPKKASSAAKPAAKRQTKKAVK